MAMPGRFASGTWHVNEGKDEEFIQRWREFLEWTRAAHPALEHAWLIRDQVDPLHFLSFAEWPDDVTRDAWKESAGFEEKFGKCRELCERFHGGNYETAVSVS